MAKKPLFEAIATLVGIIIGAGILGIPFVVAKAGFFTGVVVIIILGLVMMFMNLLVGEISLRTKKSHQLTGYAQEYLGKKGRIFMSILLILGIYGALTAYIIKIGEFLSELININFFSPLVCSTLFFIFGYALVYSGLKAIEESELYMVIFILAIVIILFAFSFSKIKTGNLTGFNLKNLFLPFGVILFAYMGTASIPEMREELRGNEKLMKKTLIIGSLIPMLIYLLFTFIVIGVSGNSTTDGAIIGLKNFLGPWIFAVGLIFGILTMATSFLANGLALKEVYNFDFNLSKTKASFLSCTIPFITAVLIITMKVHNGFYKVLDLTGAIVFPLTAIALILIFWKAKKHSKRKPEFSLWKNKTLGIILIILFLFAMLYKILKLSGFLF